MGIVLRFYDQPVLPIDRIRSAAERARPHVLRSPLVPLDAATWLKLECLQPTGSFKVRGFFARALQLSEGERSRGLITVSAGNAAQACAYVANRLGVSCRVMMYETAPSAKIEGVRRWGAEPRLIPRDAVLAWMGSQGWEEDPEVFIHPFADSEVMAGHGGIGLELLEDLPSLRRVVVPAGGGGLIGGIASALKNFDPSIEVVGVQSDGYPSWTASLAAGEPAKLTPATIADGTTAPVDPGQLALMAEVVDRWITVPESRLRTAIAELAARAHVVAEGAGALAYAALDQLEPGPPTAVLVSGGNVDRKLLAEILG